VSEQVNRKCPLETTFNLYTDPEPPNLTYQNFHHSTIGSFLATAELLVSHC